MSESMLSFAIGGTTLAVALLCCLRRSSGGWLFVGYGLTGFGVAVWAHLLSAPLFVLLIGLVTIGGIGLWASLRADESNTGRSIGSDDIRGSVRDSDDVAVRAKPARRSHRWCSRGWATAAAMAIGGTVLGFVFVSTLARQFVTPGATLDPQTEFGNEEAFRSAAPRHVDALALIGLLLVSLAMWARSQASPSDDARSR